MALAFCFFIWLDLAISIVSRLFNLILLKLFGYLGFLCFEGLSYLSISSKLFLVSISEICDLCLLDSFFFLRGVLLVGFFYVFLVGIVRFGNDSRDAWSLIFGLSFFGVGGFSFVDLKLEVFLWMWFSMEPGYQVFSK